ncbi:PKD domain-containing protein [Patescibacteria group bacterium]
MDEQNKNNQNTPQDFGMEDIEEEKTEQESVKINSYIKDNKQEGAAPSPTPQQTSEQSTPSVDPGAAPPPETKPTPQPPEQATPPKPEQAAPQAPTQNAPQKTTQAPTQTAPAANQKINISQAKTPPKKAPNPAAKKKALLGCLGAFVLVVVITLVLAFVFISQGIQEDNPLANLLGVNQASFINGLITVVNLIFLLLCLVIFVFGAAGFFKAAMAKKDDKEKKGIKTAVISFVIFFILLIIWFFVFLWLDPQRISVDEVEILPAIVTVPEDTLGLTAPIEIKFDASNVPYDKKQYQILSYKWDFGDGDTGTNQIITHEYGDKGDDDGRFNVLLTVTFRDKETGEEITQDYDKIITISDQAISAIFEADPQEGEAPLEVEFDASDSVDPDGDIDTYEWDFDEDGEFDDAEGINVSNEFDKTGTYTISLRVTSTTGDFAISDLDIVVGEETKPEAIITITDEPTTFLIGEQYVFKGDDSSSPNGKISDYEWDFGDGSPTVTTKTASHTYDNAGTFEVTLLVIDEEGKEDEASKTITIGAPQGTPKAIISTDPVISGDSLSLSGSAPFTVVFDASGSTDSDNNIVDYEWDFDGDGVTDGYGAKASYSYNASGTYNAKVKVIDSDGNSGEETIIIQVEAQGVTANIQADKVDGSVPLTVNFDASGSAYPGGQIVGYTWDFGDGGSPKSGTSTISHKYTTIGSFTASVIALGADSTSSTADILITVREIPLQACFTSVFTEGPAPLQTTFDPGCSSGTIATYSWDFGDGNTSTEVKPTNTFQNSGQYPVKLEITDVDNTVSVSELIINVTD